MKISRNKILSVLAIVLLLSMAASLSTMRPAFARTIYTHLYCTVSPDPTGVGQQTGFVVWTDIPVDGSSATNDLKYHNYSIQIFGPDGKMIPPTSPTAEANNCTINMDLIFDSTASGFTFFTPTVPGHYTFFINHPTEFIGSPTYNNPPLNTYVGNNVSGAFDVQQEPIPAARDSFPLPTEYWARPIENQNVYWFAISSNWLNDVKDRNYQGQLNNRFQEDGIAPNTPHVMWAAPVTDTMDAFQFGGTIASTSSTFYNSPPFANPIIMNGNLYFAVPNATGGVNTGEIKIVDLRTGQIKNDITNIGTVLPTWGTYYDADNPNQHGATPADGTLFGDAGVISNPAMTYNNNSLFVGFKNGTQWLGYRVGNPDGQGNSPLVQFLTMNDVPTFGAQAQGITGEILIGFVFNNGANITNPTGQDWELRIWNQTNVQRETTSGIQNASATTQTSELSNISQTTGGPAVKVISSSGVPVILQPDTVPVSLQITEQNYTYRPFENYYLLCRNGTFPTAGNNNTAGVTYFAIAADNEAPINGINYKPGTIMWMTTIAPPANGASLIQGPSAEGVFTVVEAETGIIHAYDMTTGQKLWDSIDITAATPYPYTPATTATGCTAAIAYNTLYTAGSSGQVYAYDLKTGTLKWGTQYPMTTPTEGVSYWPTNIGVIADGKIYLGTYTLTQTSLYSGAVIRCLDAWTGAELWSMPGWGGAGGYAVSDGYMTFLNYYDLQTYVVGRGPSAITVNSPGLGDMNKVTITGTITDASPGSQFKGSGCIADQYMGEWMAYLFQGAAKPAGVKGVDVTISVIDPNGNPYDVGTVAANTDGTFSLDFKPQVPGQYSVIANFKGTNGYFPSFAHTAVFVNEVAGPTPTPTPTPVSNTGTYLLGGTAAIIIALVIAAVVLLLVLRKRP